MFCSNCGAENPDTAKFCRNCGKPLNAAAPEGQAQNQGQSYENTGFVNTGYQAAGAQTFAEPQNRLNPAVIIVPIVAAIAAILIGVFFLVKPGSGMNLTADKFEKACEANSFTVNTQTGGDLKDSLDSLTDSDDWQDLAKAGINASKLKEVSVAMSDDYSSEMVYMGFSTSGIASKMKKYVNKTDSIDSRFSDYSLSESEENGVLAYTGDGVGLYFGNNFIILSYSYGYDSPSDCDRILESLGIR